MARHKNNRMQTQPNAGAAQTADPLAHPNGPGVSTIVERGGPGDLVRAPTRGGSFGIIPEAERRIAMHNLVASGGLNKNPTNEDPIIAQQFQLIDGPRVPGGDVSFMYEGCRTNVKIGKIFSSACYDMALLKRQGLVFKELEPAPKSVEMPEDLPLQEEESAPPPA